MFEGYAKKEVPTFAPGDNDDQHAGNDIYAEPKSGKIVQEPDYVTPSFKIRKFNINNMKELDMAKQDIYRRYAFIDDANVRAKSALNIAPISRISTGYKRS